VFDEEEDIELDKLIIKELKPKEHFVYKKTEK